MSSPPDRQLESAAELFALLAVPIRLRIVCGLRGGEMSRSRIGAETGAIGASLAHHLLALIRGGVLARRRVGREFVYRIARPGVDALCEALKAFAGGNGVGPADGTSH